VLGTALTMLVPLGIGAPAFAGTAGPNLGGEVCRFSPDRPIIRPGMTGPAVAQLQCLLNHALDPARFPPLPIDGIAGPATRQRILIFQSCAAPPADGITSPRFWQLLLEWALSPGYAC